MLFEQSTAVARRLRDLTKAGKLRWRKDDDGWYSAKVRDQNVSFRFLYFEAVNQPGADPRMVQVTMPSFNHVFAFGTEGAALFFEILAFADVGWMSIDRYADSHNKALAWLDSVAT